MDLEQLCSRHRVDVAQITVIWDRQDSISLQYFFPESIWALRCAPRINSWAPGVLIHFHERLQSMYSDQLLHWEWMGGLSVCPESLDQGEINKLSDCRLAMCLWLITLWVWAENFLVICPRIVCCQMKHTSSGSVFHMIGSISRTPVSAISVLQLQHFQYYNFSTWPSVSIKSLDLPMLTIYLVYWLEDIVWYPWLPALNILSNKRTGMWNQYLVTFWMGMLLFHLMVLNAWSEGEMGTAHEILF